MHYLSCKARVHTIPGHSKWWTVAGSASATATLGALPYLDGVVHTTPVSQSYNVAAKEHILTIESLTNCLFAVSAYLYNRK